MLYFYYITLFLLYFILFIAELHMPPHLPTFHHNNTQLYFIYHFNNS